MFRVEAQQIALYNHSEDEQKVARIKTLAGSGLTAADINNDGDVNIFSLVYPLWRVRKARRPFSRRRVPFFKSAIRPATTARIPSRPTPSARPPTPSACGRRSGQSKPVPAAPAQARASGPWARRPLRRPHPPDRQACPLAARPGFPTSGPARRPVPAKPDAPGLVWART